MHTTTTTTSETPAHEVEASAAIGARAARVLRHVALSGRNIWDFVDVAAAARPLFAWRDPIRDHTFVAWGEAARFCETRRHAFAALQRWCSVYNERSADDAPMPAGLPLCVGGHSFSPGVQTGPWSDWPAMVWIVPKFLAYQLDDGRQGLLLRGDARLAEALAPAPDRAAAVAPSLRWRSDPQPDGYRALVHDALNDIAGGRLHKVVTARRCAARAAAGFDPIATLHALRRGHGGATVFGLRHGDAWWMGATPETLVAVERGALATHALAGTSAREADPDGRQLLHSQKDLVEHRLVVDGIRAALGPICGALALGDRRVVTAGAVQHLMTPIRARLRDGLGALDAAARLHPTAALCGAPRDRAARWIADHESARGWYGGAVGWLAQDGDGVLAVAIRSLLVRASEATAYVGAGVVAASDPDAEWRETEAKLQAVTAALRVLRGTP